MWAFFSSWGIEQISTACKLFLTAFTILNRHTKESYDFARHIDKSLHFHKYLRINSTALCSFLSLEFLSTAPFENPPESRDGNRPESVKQDQLKTPPPKSTTPTNRGRSPARPKTPPTQDEINMLIDEEMSMFPEKKYVVKFLWFCTIC